jgi:hypothetical protein
VPEAYIGLRVGWRSGYNRTDMMPHSCAILILDRHVRVMRLFCDEVRSGVASTRGNKCEVMGEMDVGLRTWCRVYLVVIW